MKRTYKLLAFIIALSMVMSTVILPASAAGGMTDSDYVAPAGENLFATWGLNYDYDTTASAVVGLYGYNGKDVAINKKGSPSVSATTIAGREGKTAAHFGAQFDTAFADGIYLDNFVLTEVIPTVAVASTTPANEATGVATDATISVTFNTAVGALTPANFLMSGGASVTDVETTDNKTFTLTTTALSNNTEYTVFVTNVSASGYTTLTTYSFTFKTNDGTAPVPPVQEYDTPNANLGANLLATAGFNWNLEGSDSAVRLDPVVGETDPYYQQDDHKTAWGTVGTCTYGVVTDQDAPDGTDGLGALLVSDRSDEGAGRRINYVAYMPNKTYRASVWVKLADEYAIAPVSLRFSDAGATMGKVTKYSPETFTANGQVWTKVYTDFTTSHKVVNSEEQIGRGYFHLSCVTTGYTGDLYVDGFSICEIKDDVLTVEKAVTEDDVLKIRFTSKVPAANFTAANVEINRGAVVKSVTRKNDVQYEVEFENLVGETEYTVTLKNIANAGTGVLDDYTTTFTTGVKEPVTSTFDVITFDNGLMSPFTQGGGNCAAGSHWVVSNEDSHSGEYSLFNDGNNCGGQGIYNGPAVEPFADYVLTFWAKFDGTITVVPRAEGAKAISGGVVTNSNNNIVTVNLEGDGTWKQYSVKFNSSITINGTTYGNDKLYIRLNCPAQATYFDDFALYKELGNMAAVYAAPGEEDTNVDVQTDVIKVKFTNPVSNYIDELNTNIEKYVSIDNGAVITGVSIDTDGSTLVLDLDDSKLLSPKSKYTVTVKNILDSAGQLAEEKSFSFTTEPGIKMLTPLRMEDNHITASVQNRCDASIGTPVIVYTLYDGDELKGICASTFAGTVDRLGEADLSLYVPSPGDYTDEMYLIANSNDITYLVQPEYGTTDVTSNIVTDTDAGTVTISGTGGVYEDVTIVLLKPSNAEKNAANVASYKNDDHIISASDLLATGVSAIDEGNIAEYTVHFKLVTTDSEGNYTLTLPVEKTDTTTVYGVITSGSGFASNSMQAVYMPSTTELSDAENAINNASTAAQMQDALDTYGAALGFDTASAVYGTDAASIAKALLAKKPSGGFTDFTSGVQGSAIALFDDISAYYSRQRDALAVINSATNAGITVALGNYSDVLGAYESSAKLDYQAKYTQYGEYAVNQKIISLRATKLFTSMDDFITQFNAIEIKKEILGGGSPGGNTTGAVGGSPVTPGISLPESAKPEAQAMFNDIADVEWAREAIENLANRGIINGMGDGSFAPHSNVTREQFIKMLVQSFNIPTASGNAFADVDNSEWYAPYVYGAYNAGIVTGISDTEFGVGASITRQDLVTMIYRVMVSLDAMPDEVTDTYFDDEHEVSGYAKDAVQVLANAGLINGMSDGIFAPAQNATRAQTAVILDRLFTTYLDVYFY